MKLMGCKEGEGCLCPGSVHRLSSQHLKLNIIKGKSPWNIKLENRHIHGDLYPQQTTEKKSPLPLLLNTSSLSCSAPKVLPVEVLGH